METQTVFQSPEIECDGCAASIKRVLTSMPGVHAVQVDVAKKTVVVEHDPKTASGVAIAATLDKAGFPSTAVGAA